MKTIGNECKSRLEINKKQVNNFFSLTEFQFIGHNILKVSLLENGSNYGNSGNGPVVKIKFENQSCTQMLLNGNESNDFVIEFRGISERNQIASLFELISKELLK